MTLISTYWFVVSWDPEGRLVQFKDVPLKTRRALSLYKFYGNSALLVLNGTSLTPFWLSSSDMLLNDLEYV